ncbi:MAG: 5,10-methylenetetrahydromethanopterin reductase [Candidatus Hadarchaeaceae archaeon]
MKFGIEFVPYEPIDKVVELARNAEEAGFEYCWVTDHYNNRNVYSFLTAIAQNTKKMMIGPGVTNPYLIHPAVVASAIASIDEISNGRAILGISAGDRTILGSLGVKLERPLGTVSESIQIIRKLLTGDRINFEGKIFRLKGVKLNFKPKHGIPIYMGAQGPGMLRLAGKISDGVLVNASHPLDLNYAISQIRRGSDEAGRDLREIDFAAYTSFSVASSDEEARKAAGPVVVFIVSAAPSSVLERHGISIEDVSKVRKALESGNFGEAMAGVTKAMFNSFCIHGTPADCIKRIEEILKSGVTQLVIGSPIGPDPSTSIGIIRDEIMPSFR